MNRHMDLNMDMYTKNEYPGTEDRNYEAREERYM
jgi:hypothetical protein